MASVVIGFDPGITGAFALFEAGRLKDVRDVPLVEKEVKIKGADIRDLIGGQKKKVARDLDIAGMVALLREWTRTNSVRVVTEEVHAMPNQGVVSTTKFLRTVHVVEGICATLAVPLTIVPPDQWKKATQTPTDKDGARQHAIKLFPKWRDCLKLKKDHNRAEAILIGMYGVKQEC